MLTDVFNWSGNKMASWLGGPISPSSLHGEMKGFMTIGNKLDRAFLLGIENDQLFIPGADLFNDVKAWYLKAGHWHHSHILLHFSRVGHWLMVWFYVLTDCSLVIQQWALLCYIAERKSLAFVSNVQNDQGISVLAYADQKSTSLRLAQLFYGWMFSCYNETYT